MAANVLNACGVVFNQEHVGELNAQQLGPR